MESKRAAWMMGGITEAPVEEYLYGLLPERDAVLNAIEQQAAERNIPIVGPAVGRLLYLLARSIGARTVFEMGSAVGYSTIWWARALGEGGRVVYTDGDRRNAEEARRNFESARVLDKIDIRVGDALEILSEQRAESFDIIFNDVDKQDYPRVFKLAVPRLRKGGLFISDNVLWSGRVAQAGEKDESTAAIREFNRLLYGSRELYTSVLPLRDGVSVSLKL
jgi:predicted O-methyltransferase YrrM